jgi:hypothetical protein
VRNNRNVAITNNTVQCSTLLKNTRRAGHVKHYQLQKATGLKISLQYCMCADDELCMSNCGTAMHYTRGGMASLRSPLGRRSSRDLRRGGAAIRWIQQGGEGGGWSLRTSTGIFSSSF